MANDKFLEAVKDDTALQHELSAAVNASIVSVAKKHGFDLSEDDLNQKDHKLAAQAGCSVQLTKTSVCTF